MLLSNAHDGELDVSGALRIVHLRDGYYVAGCGRLIYGGDTRDEAELELAYWQNRERAKTTTAQIKNVEAC